MSDDQLMPVIEKVLKESDCSYKDLTNIAVVNGPGGFTSLRMAVTLANVLADQLRIPSVGIHLSDLYHARVNFESGILNLGQTENQNSEFNIQDSSSFLWLHSTKKTELFVRGFGSFATVWPEPILLSIDDFAEKVPSGALWAGELIADHCEVLAEKNLHPGSLTPLNEALPTFLASQKYEKTLILPWYGRGW